MGVPEAEKEENLGFIVSWGAWWWLVSCRRWIVDLGVPSSQDRLVMYAS